MQAMSMFKGGKPMGSPNQVGDPVSNSLSNVPGGQPGNMFPKGSIFVSPGYIYRVVNLLSFVRF